MKMQTNSEILVWRITPEYESDLHIDAKSSGLDLGKLIKDWGGRSLVLWGGGTLTLATFIWKGEEFGEFAAAANFAGFKIAHYRNA
jgi:hypothetical protein